MDREGAGVEDTEDDSGGWACIQHTGIRTQVRSGSGPRWPSAVCTACSLLLTASISTCFELLHLHDLLIQARHSRCVPSGICIALPINTQVHATSPSIFTASYYLDQKCQRHLEPYSSLGKASLFANMYMKHLPSIGIYPD